MLQKVLPGFKSTCFIVGSAFILLSASLFAKGLMPSMSEFKVPDIITQSPHYYDAIFWVYMHMMVLGLLIMALGYGVDQEFKQKWVACILTLVTAIYTFIDFRHSDSALGNSLYQGEASVAPAIISMVVTLLFLQITIRLFMKKT